MKHSTSVIETDGQVDYFPNWMDENLARYLLQRLDTAIAWQHDEVIMFGKRIMTQRKVAWYGDRSFIYPYSQTKKIALPWCDELIIIKDKLEQELNLSFNSCLLNRYASGSEGMGWHSDNEAQMRRNGVIASLSLGATRDFQFKHKHTGEQVQLTLEAGSLLIMKGQTQEFWKHQLPVRKRVKEMRINLTFREFVEPNTK